MSVHLPCYIGGARKPGLPTTFFLSRIATLRLTLKSKVVFIGSHCYQLAIAQPLQTVKRMLTFLHMNSPIKTRCLPLSIYIRICKSRAQDIPFQKQENITVYCDMINTMTSAFFLKMQYLTHTHSFPMLRTGALSSSTRNLISAPCELGETHIYTLLQPSRNLEQQGEIDIMEQNRKSRA